MNIIKFNDVEFEVISYNKNTFFSDDTISSSASCQIIIANMDTLNNLANTAITSLQILHDGNVIYNLSDINAHIENISEYLNVDRMDINVSLRFE